MKKTIVALLLFFLCLLSGCGTPGSLKSDRRTLDANYANVHPEGKLTVVFDSLPGKIGDAYCYAPGMWSSASLDASEVAIGEAFEVFKHVYEDVKIVILSEGDATDAERDSSDSSCILRLRARATTSSFSGAHVAVLEVRAIDEQGRTVFEYSDTEKVYDAFQYAQVDTMQRAFLRIYRRVADRLLKERADKGR